MGRAWPGEHPSWAVLGPRIFTDVGRAATSLRNFPSFVDAAGHALLAQFKPDNPYTLVLQPRDTEGDTVVPADWVSGSCFLARARRLGRAGGFRRGLFHVQRGHGSLLAGAPGRLGSGLCRGTAAVTHVQGVSTARHPYRMIVAHHRSALRFTMRPCWARAAPHCLSRPWSWEFAWPMALVRQSLAR